MNVSDVNIKAKLIMRLKSYLSLMTRLSSDIMFELIIDYEI